MKQKFKKDQVVIEVDADSPSIEVARFVLFLETVRDTNPDLKLWIEILWYDNEEESTFSIDIEFDPDHFTDVVDSVLRCKNSTITGDYLQVYLVREDGTRVNSSETDFETTEDVGDMVLY